MRSRLAFGVILATLTVAACQDPVAPAVTDEAGPAFAAVQTGPDNRCYGEIIAGISRTWPFAHDDHMSFAPPKGAIAFWVELFGPAAGISSVRELQILFCTVP